MTRTLATYGAIAVAMLALDLLWLGLIARPLYRQGIGHLMAETPNLVAALLFYGVYAGGLLLFAVLPNSGEGWGRALLMAALFGGVAYATYDLSNLATLKGWPASLALLDIAWGSLASLLAAAAGRLAWQRVGGP